MQIGNYVGYIMRGEGPLVRRTAYVSANKDGNVNYECATGAAIKFDVLSPLMNWYRDKLGWHDGGYSSRDFNG